MADTSDVQPQQGYIEQESALVTDVAQTGVAAGGEIIELSDDDEISGRDDGNGSKANESVTLKHSDITVDKGDELNQIRKKYHSIFERQSRALPPNIPLSRKFLDMALAVSSADKKHIMDRHKKEWKAAMNLAGKKLKEEKEKMEWILEEEIHHEKEKRAFRVGVLGGSVQRYKEHKKNADLLEKMFEDLKEL
ncbi:hypothetical protein KC340_g6973 [Hortaea werneckii]|nr:hypothetical protein KC342_g6780 [Hortaea werneckii]KAI7322604.1 hypothetical protein KC340_g6973 [Hortaea werneckii]KAI7397878.1 hypothetical protein KC328_g4713 [Hortaea werneckii]